MIPRLHWILAFSLFASSSSALASGEHGDEAAPAQVGLDKAVTAFDEHDGFRLSDKAIKALGVEFLTLAGAGRWTLPKSALVRVKHSTGVYRRVGEGWITLVLVKVMERTESSVVIQSVDPEPGDQVATRAVSALRITEIDLTTESEGHSH